MFGVDFGTALESGGVTVELNIEFYSKNSIYTSLYVGIGCIFSIVCAQLRQSFFGRMKMRSQDKQSDP